MKSPRISLAAVLLTGLVASCSSKSTNGESVKDCSGGCSIDDVCYPDGVYAPGDVCRICNTTASATAWSFNNGAPCDDGLYCTVGDVCASGTCGGAARDCSDGVACTGVESCDEATNACAAGTPTCTGTMVCEYINDACVATCTGCVITGVCYGDGQTNPTNPCAKCDSMADASGWTDNDGTACDDGLYCTVGDVCASGTCGGAARDCSDGVACTGVESCDEDEDTCVSSGDPCATSGDACLEDTTSFLCCTPGVAMDDPACNAAGDVVRHDECGDELLIEDCLGPAAHGLCINGVCGCADGLAGDDCWSCLVHVNGATGSDTNDGHTWALAKKTVQAGLDAAAAAISSGFFSSCEVWVAAGTYFPTRDTSGEEDPSNIQTKTISLKANVAVYGGLAGNEFVRAERDVVANLTILSGDLGTPDNSSDNAYHVVTGANDAVIDGFTITAGNANAGAPNNGGGGMYNNNASPTVTSCTFSGNTADYSGGGMYNNNASPTVTSCTFSGNTADYNGGGMYNNNASPTVTSCTFSGNTANNGGGMFNLNASPTVTSCTFSDNSASFSGGGMFNYHASPTVTSCILWGNSAIDGAQIYDVSSSSPTVSYSIVQGGYDGNLGDDPQLDSELRIVSTDSPAIDAGNGCVAPVIDKDGLGRVDIASKGNTGLGPAVDIGAYEYQGGAGDTPAPAPSPDTCCTIDSDASLPHDYYYCDFSPLSWEAAKAYCENSGIHLASIGGEIEQTVVSELVGTNYAFIGATDAATEDMWLWSDGTSFDYTNWAVADSEPNGSTSANCMAIDGSRSGQWDDTTCSNLLAFVCESAD